MSNASLKEQLLAVASRISDTRISDIPSDTRKASPAKAAKPIKRQPHTGHKSKPAFKAKTNSDSKRHAVKPKWLEVAQNGVELLKTHFPQCFKLPGEMKPLKIGIKQDLIKFLNTMENIVTEDKACMIKSLSYYVNTLAYHRSVVEGTTRTDLQGNPAGVVTAAEAKYSSDRQQARIQARQATATTPHSPQPVKEVNT